MNIEEFKKYVSELNINCTDEILEKLSIYATFLLEYNKHTNLTAIRNEEDVYLKHFYDSLTITKMINLNEVETLADIGTGAGFPGMIIKIFFPNIKVTLIDSNNKKITFLKELINKLNLKDIEALNVRSEEYALTNLDKYDIVTARAVSALPVLTEICLPFVKENGYFVPLKAEVDKELELSKNILNKLNGELIDRIEFRLPKEDSIRNILKIKKTGITPKGYPRSYSKIKSEYEKSIK